jgi:hypothetical protein
VIYRQIMELIPELPVWAKENRRWLQRAVSWLSREQRVDQFLDLGAGLPTAQNTHQIAQGINPRPGWCTSTMTRQSSRTGVRC